MSKPKMRLDLFLNLKYVLGCTYMNRMKKSEKEARDQKAGKGNKVHKKNK